MSGLIPFPVGFSAGAAFTPLALPSLYAWWDMSDSANVVLSGSNVSQLTDKSGNAHHATQATSGNQFVKSAASINGLDSMVDNAGHSSYMAFTPLSSNASLSVIAVAKPTSSHTSPNVFGPAAGGAGSFGWASLTSTPSVVYEVSPTKSFVNPWSTSMSTQHMIAMVWNQVANTLAGWGDSANLLPATTTGTAPSGLSFGQIGYGSASGYTFTGNVCEIIVCAAALSSTDIANVYAYLKAKWSLS